MLTPWVHQGNSRPLPVTPTSILCGQAAAAGSPLGEGGIEIRLLWMPRAQFFCEQDLEHATCTTSQDNPDKDMYQSR